METFTLSTLGSQNRTYARILALGLADPVVYCRRCGTWVAVSATRELSTHTTSGGLVTYFRCTAGHAHFYRTSAAVPGPGHPNAGKDSGPNAINGTEEGKRT